MSKLADPGERPEHWTDPTPRASKGLAVTEPNFRPAAPARAGFREATTHRIEVEPPNGWVIKFALKFSRDSQVYNYAALKVGGRWFTTGRTCPPQGYSWPALCEFIDGEDLVARSLKVWDGE